MSSEAATHGNEDVAWASIALPLSESELLEFCQDVERLFRINPFLEFEQWQPIGDTCYQFSGKNSSQETPFVFDVKLRVKPQADGVLIEYENSLKQSTSFKVEPDSMGSKLTITDDYGALTEQEKQERLHEVDRSLVNWAKEIHSYICQWKRWKKFAIYRWYMRRVWQPLKPMGRRIVYMLIWISIFEMALIALGVGIYWAEH